MPTRRRCPGSGRCPSSSRTRSPSSSSPARRAPAPRRPRSRCDAEAVRGKDRIMADREGTTTKERRGTGAKDLAAMVVAAGHEHDGAALRYHDGDDWTELASPALLAAAREIAGGLIALGLEAGDRVAIFSETRPEWTLADLGAILAGLVVVPIYQTSSVEEAHHVLQDSAAKLVFCEDEEKVGTIRDATEALDIAHLVVL